MHSEHRKLKGLSRSSLCRGLIVLGIIFIKLGNFYIYPKFADSNGNKIAAYVLLMTVLVLFIVVFNFQGSEYNFSTLVEHLDWFWFIWLTYFLIEIPFMLWYFKMHEVKFCLTHRDENLNTSSSLLNTLVYKR
jgi:hypothetical protein